MSDSSIPIGFDPAVEHYIPTRTRDFLSNPITLVLGELSYDILTGQLQVGDGSSARSLLPYITPFRVSGLIAPATAVSTGNFTTFDLVGVDGSVAATLNRADYIGSRFLIVSGANVGIWTITAHTASPLTPCTPSTPQPRESDIVSASGGFLLVGSGSDGDITAPAAEFSSLTEASAVRFTPATPGDWPDPDPVDVAGGLNDLADITATQTANIATNTSAISANTTAIALRALLTQTASGTTTVTGGTIGGASTSDVVVSLSRTLPDANYIAIPFIQVGSSGYADLITLSCRVKTQSTTSVTVTVNNAAVGVLAVAIAIRVVASY